LVAPLFELAPAGGQVVVTRFECPSRLVLAFLLLLHTRIKRDVRRFAPGMLGARTIVDWRHRTLLSVTLWTDITSVYDMGSVARHVSAARFRPAWGYGPGAGCSVSSATGAG